MKRIKGHAVAEAPTGVARALLGLSLLLHPSYKSFYHIFHQALADLLGDEKAVAPLIKFLKTTGIGGQEGAKERELERERKNEREGENLLG